MNEQGFFFIVPDWIARRLEMSAVDKLVFCKIRRWNEVYETAFPQQFTLARELGLNRQTIGESVRRLQAHGLPHVVPKGKGYSYRVLDHPWEVDTPRR